MRHIALIALAPFALAMAGSAHANTCQTDKLTCTTTMPVDGYCECTKKGVTEGGTVVTKASHGANATAGGCGVDPKSPGCH